MSTKRKAEKSLEVDEEIAKISKQIENFENDEAAIFGRSVATKLRNFDPYTFALARKNIEVMLFDLQFGQANQSPNLTNGIRSAYHNACETSWKDSNQSPCSSSRLGSSVGCQPGYSSGSQPHNSAGYSTGQPSSFSGEPGYSTGQPSSCSGEPSYSTGQPSSRSGEHSYSTGQPSSRSGEHSYSTGSQSDNNADTSTGSQHDITGYVAHLASL